MDISFSLHVWPTFLLVSIYWVSYCCGVSCEQRPLPVVYSGIVSLELVNAIFGVLSGEKVVSPSNLRAKQRWVQQCQLWSHSAGSAAGGGSVREDPVFCQGVLVGSSSSKFILARKHSFYSLGWLWLSGNTLSAFQRLGSFDCSCSSSRDLPHDSQLMVNALGVCSSGSLCQPGLSRCIVTVLFGAWWYGHYRFWPLVCDKSLVLKEMEFPLCFWTTCLCFEAQFPTGAVYPVLLLASDQPSTWILAEVEKT